MAYTAVPAKSTGDPAYTAGFLNTYVKNNFAAGVPDLFIGKGDIAAATGNNIAARIDGGPDTNYVLQIYSSASTGLRWRFQPSLDQIIGIGYYLVGSASKAFGSFGTPNTKGYTLEANSAHAYDVDFSNGAGLYGLVAAKGDLIAGTAADTAARVAAGAINGSVLVTDSNEATGMRWRNNGAAKFYNQTTQNVETATWTTIDFNTEVFDVAGAATVGSDSYTVPVTGYYVVSFSNLLAPALAANLLNKRFACALVDGSNTVLSIVGAQHRMTASTTAPFGILKGLDILYLTAGTVVYPKYYHDYGSTYSFNVANSGQGFSISRIGA